MNYTNYICLFNIIFHINTISIIKIYKSECMISNRNKINFYHIIAFDSVLHMLRFFSYLTDFSTYIN